MRACRSRLYAITCASGSARERGCGGIRRADEDRARLMEGKWKGETEQYERWEEIVVADIACEGARTQHASGRCATSVPLGTSTMVSSWREGPEEVEHWSDDTNSEMHPISVAEDINIEVLIVLWHRSLAAYVWIRFRSR
ncbi:hypothetical protein B0H14DRAFT_2605955 [Mycena olivaceomarginata]|nr:hypothetical protein B0H14DRAFT_2605955 [Mycena olivaceomarginata]